MTHSENEPTPPAGGGRSTDAIWYYEKIGAQPIGPVTEESIKLLLEAKTITLIHGFGTNHLAKSGRR